MKPQEKDRADVAHRAAEVGAGTLRTPAQLLAAGLIAPEELVRITEVSAQFAVAITPHMRSLIEPGCANDPIAAQFVPSAAELNVAEGELTDPIGDEAHSPVAGIVHRYPDRVLLKPLQVCPVYCRFCFRREAVGPGHAGLDEAELEAAFAYIESCKQIWEVVVTGGDPFVLSPRRMAGIMRRLDSIGHVRVVRFHTRVPVVRPDLVSDELLDALRIKKAVFVVLHVNHVNELSAAARDACARLVDRGLPMLSQTVLLRGVNADAQTLETLFRALVETRIKPYYLHQGDLAKGTGHFRTSLATGQDVMRTLRGRVSGVCQPLYVLDIPGGHGKVPVGPNYLTSADERGEYRVCDYLGNVHAYQDSA